MELVVEPLDGPVDDAPRISVSGRPERESINLTIDVVDAAGHAWRSVSVVGNGTAPRAPWWSMKFVSRDVAPTAFTAPSDQLVYRLTATAGPETATADVVRRWGANDVTVTISASSRPMAPTRFTLIGDLESMTTRASRRSS